MVEQIPDIKSYIGIDVEKYALAGNGEVSGEGLAYDLSGFEGLGVKDECRVFIGDAEYKNLCMRASAGPHFKRMLLFPSGLFYEVKVELKNLSSGLAAFVAKEYAGKEAVLFYKMK